MENFETIKKEVSQMKTKIDQIYYALVGNDLSKDGGISKRLTDLEGQVEVLEAFRQKFMWTMGLIAAGSSIVGFILSFVLSYLLKK